MQRRILKRQATVLVATIADFFRLKANAAENIAPPWDQGRTYISSVDRITANKIDILNS
jgi:hypothetical protein